MNYYSFNIKRYSSIILLISILSGFSSCRYIERKIYFRKHSLKSAMEWARQDSTRVADSLKRVKAENRTFNNTLTDSLIDKEKINVPERDTFPRYYIIIGSFTEHVNAEKAAGQYTGQGYKTTIIKLIRKDGTILELVSVRTFNDFGKANLFLKDFQSQFDPDAWIYSRK